MRRWEIGDLPLAPEASALPIKLVGVSAFLGDGLMAQDNLFMVKIIREKKNASGSLGLNFFGLGDDGHDYALKTLSDGLRLPATEWICYSLCRAIGLATPDFLAVERLDGSVAFGSRMETTDQFRSALGVIQFVKLFSANVLDQSRIYGADAFLGNVDRHLGNFLFRSRTTGLLPLAFDFDQAWVNFSMPFGSIPWTLGCKSHLALNFLKSSGYFDPAFAMQAGQALVSLPNDALQKALDSCHNSWTTGINWAPTLKVWDQRASHWQQAQTSLN